MGPHMNWTSSIPRDATGHWHGRVVLVWQCTDYPVIGYKPITEAQWRNWRHARKVAPRLTKVLEVQMTHGFTDNYDVIIRAITTNGVESAAAGYGRLTVMNDRPQDFIPGKNGDYRPRWRAIEGVPFYNVIRIDGFETFETPALLPGDHSISRARAFAKHAHENQVRKGGAKTPYIDHPRRVACAVFDGGLSHEAVAAAWLHDVLEDTPYEINEFPERVVALVELLTHRKDQETKHQYLDRLEASGDVEAIAIKVADRCDNLKEGMRTLDNRWLKKYLRTSKRILAMGTAVSAPGTGSLSALIASAERRLDGEAVWDD
ncbi:MAG: HD domain-containing protein [Planctomycetota bacterium]|nr:MAG: HD domain-containing protein [Planctomycetota bacterium]